MNNVFDKWCPGEASRFVTNESDCVLACSSFRFSMNLPLWECHCVEYFVYSHVQTLSCLVEAQSLDVGVYSIHLRVQLRVGVPELEDGWTPLDVSTPGSSVLGQMNPLGLSVLGWMDSSLDSRPPWIVDLPGVFRQNSVSNALDHNVVSHTLDLCQ